MNYFNKKVEIPKPLNGEYIATIKEHMDKSDEKGNRYLIRLNIENRMRDYYIFPSTNDYELDENGNLKKSQLNYLLSVFSRITEDYESDLITKLDKIQNEQIQFMVNISYSEEYGRDNISFYPVRTEEEAPEL